MPTMSGYQRNNTETEEMSPDDHTAKLIQDAKKAKAMMFQLPGKLNISQIDEDYLMIDTHLDDNLKKKIQSYEFVDFGKLIAKNRNYQDEHQRLEIVNKNGMSFLSSVSDRETININTYARWEQAFRVYSNVLMSKYLTKTTELLQYNHTIHTAAMSYVWDNVYAYDKEFRHHIARHPCCSWSVILQQVWTILLKDRLSRGDNFFQRGYQPSNNGQKGSKEPCRHFNRGKCSYGLSCKFDHRCSVKKCGKWGHGAHICRHRHQDSEMGVNGNNTNVSSDGNYNNNNSAKK